MGNWATARLGLAVTGAGFLAGCWGLAACGDADKPPAPAVPVLVTKPVVQTVPVYGEWVGTLKGFFDAKITAQVTGYLQTQVYKEGTFVKKGEPLFNIDPAPFEAALGQARAKLGQAIANQQLTEITYNRLRPLAAENVVSQQELDEARQQNQAGLATVAEMRAAVAAARINLDFTHIKAPLDGLAGIRQASIGDLVGPQGNVSTLTWVSQVDPIYAEFPIPEAGYMAASKLLNPYTAGDKARPARLELYLSDGTLWPLKGAFSFANNRIDPETGTLLVRATFPNPEKVLRPGQFALVRAVVKRVKDAITVPQGAMQQLQGGYFVLTVGKDSKVVSKKVTPGVKYQGQWVVTEGLSADETVVVEGGNKVRSGQVVAPKPWTPPGKKQRSGVQGSTSGGGGSTGTAGTPAGGTAPAGGGGSAGTTERPGATEPGSSPPSAGASGTVPGGRSSPQ